MESAAAAALRALLWKDRKSTRLNSSHSQISYAVFCLKKKKKDELRAHHLQLGERRADGHSHPETYHLQNQHDHRRNLSQSHEAIATPPRTDGASACLR